MKLEEDMALDKTIITGTTLCVVVIIHCVEDVKEQLVLEVVVRPQETAFLECHGHTCSVLPALARGQSSPV